MADALLRGGADLPYSARRSVEAFLRGDVAAVLDDAAIRAPEIAGGLPPRALELMQGTAVDVTRGIPRTTWNGLDAAGTLVPGLHPVTAGELLLRYAWNDQRATMLTSMFESLASIRRDHPDVRWIAGGGSFFATSKRVPGDIDLLVLDAASVGHSFTAEAARRRNQFEPVTHLYPALDFPSGGQNRITLYGSDRAGVPRGTVLIDLDELGIGVSEASRAARPAPTTGIPARSAPIRVSSESAGRILEDARRSAPAIAAALPPSAQQLVNEAELGITQGVPQSSWNGMNPSGKLPVGLHPATRNELYLRFGWNPARAAMLDELTDAVAVLRRRHPDLRFGALEGDVFATDLPTPASIGVVLLDATRTSHPVMAELGPGARVLDAGGSSAIRVYPGRASKAGLPGPNMLAPMGFEHGGTGQRHGMVLVDFEDLVRAPR